MNTLYKICSLFILLSITSCAQEQNNTLSDAEKADGWKLLFDGKTMNGWRDYNGTSLQEPWIVVDGCIQAKVNTKNGRGFIVTEQEYENFILSCDWKLTKGGNSGLIYHINERPHYKVPYVTGPEYQLIEETNFKGKLEEWQKLGVDYAMYCPDNSKKHVHPQGEWNNSKIVFDNGHVEHWLNGEKIVEFEAWSDDWYARKHKGKWAKNDEYGLFKKGHICLQDHGDPASFRNIKIKELPRRTKKQILFDGNDLKMWNAKTAKLWKVNDKSFSNNTESDKKITYLMSREYYDDFELTAEVKSSELNWGLFGRSFVNKEKALDGCLISLNSKEGSGLYTSCKAEKASTLITSETIKNSFKKNEWNQVKLKMQNDQILLFVNGVKVLDIQDKQYITKRGALGVFIMNHSKADVHWRNVEVVTL